MKKKVILLLALLSLFSVLALVLVEKSNADVLPESVLYSFDRVLEEAHLAITFNPASKVGLHLDHAKERFDEVSAELENGNNENAEQLLNEYNSEIIEAKKEVKNVEDGEEVAQLSSEIESLESENRLTLQTYSREIEDEEGLRPEIRNYPYNITDVEEEKLKLKKQTEEELEKELEEMQEASKDEGGA